RGRKREGGEGPARPRGGGEDAEKSRGREWPRPPGCRVQPRAAAPEPVTSASEADVHAELGAPGVVLAVGLAEVGAQVEAFEAAEVLEVRHVEHVRLDAQPHSARDGEVFREPQIQTLVGPEPEDV